MPEEDALQYSESVFAVGDGITRDPLTELGLDSHTIEELLSFYPNPSGAKWAADLFTFVFVSEAKISSVREAFIRANTQIAKLNAEYIPKVDYLINDYFGCVASGGVIQDNTLHWGVIGDCGILVFSTEGDLLFRTPNSVESFERFIQEGKIVFKWETKEGRKLVRSQYRNRPDQIIDGQCASYGALTGEPAAEAFLYTGEYKLSTGDIVIFYSDGFEATILHPNFFKTIQDFQNIDINLKSFSQKLAQESPEVYGRERTLIATVIK